MKKVALLLALVLIISLPMEVAASTRALRVVPTLSFSGTTATCKATVTGDNTSQYIQVNMKLMYGNTTVASWSGSGYGYVYLSKTAAAVSGRTYKLVVQVTLDGVVKDPVYVTKAC